ncbi:RNA methyltransferase [Candidatus Nomurabacteria bacterium]|nr:RNA methyltransferase [Candidatus Nomurabacteria bacterium]
MSISKNTGKFIKSLHLKKYRKEEGLFLVEGEKSIIELVQSDFEIINIYITRSIYEKYRDILSKYDTIIDIVEENELTKYSTLEFNDTGIAIVKQKDNTPISINDKEIIVALDDVRDPGNLGTIIRTCDWYGIKKIVCSETTSDFYNNKTISASMGSFARVEVYYTDLNNFLNNVQVPIIGAYLNGSDVHTFNYPNTGILLMGSESNGINKDLEKYVTDRITIPKYGNAESLNVSIATGIILDNIKRC